MKRMNKKGAEMTIGTIVVIVLALIVLVVLVFGFSQGWSNLWQKITGFGGGKVNVQTVVQSCTVACNTNNVYGWCKDRTVIFDEDGAEDMMNCDALAIRTPSVGLQRCNQIGTCANTGETPNPPAG